MQLKVWHYTFAGTRRGPVTEDEMRKLIVERTIDVTQCLVWKDGMENWSNLEAIETFRDSIDLLHRLEAEKQRENSPSPIPTLGKALEERSRKRPWPSQLTLTIRLSLSGLLFAYGWAFMNEGFTQRSVDSLISLSYFSIPTSILVTLVFAGPMRNGVSLLHRSLAGGLCSLHFLLLTYLTYLVRHGAVVGDNLLDASFINTPTAFFPYYFSHLDDGQRLIHAATFFVPFLFIGLFYTVMMAAHRHENTFSID